MRARCIARGLGRWAVQSGIGALLSGSGFSSSNDAALAAESPQLHSPAPEVAPVARELVVLEKLTVDVYLHSIKTPEGSLSCWTYVSNGLWAVGQKEIVFTVKRRPGEAENAYPRDLLGFYQSMYHMASEEQRIVDIGDAIATKPGVAPFLGRPDFLGVLFAPPQPLEGIHVTAPWLMALILTADELAVARQYGMVRVMATLGREYRFFPTAPWADRDRRELVSLRDMEQSILSKMVRRYANAASVRQESRLVSRVELPGPGDVKDQDVKLDQGRIVLRFRPGAAAELKEALADPPKDAVIALLVGPDPGALACRTWLAGHKEQVAISKPGVSGTNIEGSFIAFVPHQKDDGGRPLEDGFAIFLRDESWHQLRTALGAGRPLSVPATGDKMAFEVVWVPEADPDFADGRESQLPGGWPIFDLQPPRAWEPSGPVDQKSMALLTNPDVMGLRVEVTRLADYAEALLAAVKSERGARSAGPGQDLGLECEVRPDGTRSFRILFRPENTGEGKESLEARLMRIPPPPVVFGPIRFQLNLLLWGGSKRAAEARP
jgi:hypothetical protein